jgi:rare lipoprotein A
MAGRTRTVMVSGALLVAVMGCQADRQQEPAAEAPAEVAMAPASEMPVAAPPPVTPEELERLKEQYPVLRAEPAPEPQPNGDADPTQVPERVRQALPEPVLQQVTGGATFYASYFEGRRTASGIPFRQNQMVAAHRSFPFGTVLRVTNLQNDRAVNVRVVDRGPFGTAQNRAKTVIDLSRRAAQQLGYVEAGRTQVRIEVLEWGPGVRGSA